jgi:hypothetical protein
VQILLKVGQETDGNDRYLKLAFGPGGVVAAAFETTIHFLSATHGTVLEIIEVCDSFPVGPCFAALLLPFPPFPDTSAPCRMPMMLPSLQ